LRISFLTNVAETTLFVPVLDNSDFGHDAEFFLRFLRLVSLFLVLIVVPCETVGDMLLA
jgi:hypothetical protein